MTTETDLLPCPFCGLNVTDDEGCFPLNRERTRWEVRCGNPGCFAHEPCDDSRQAAVNRWNRRACVSSATEALRAEMEQAKGRAAANLQRAADAEARAERLAEALREVLIDLERSQANMRNAAKTDPRWEGCAAAIQPRVDTARALLREQDEK